MYEILLPHTSSQLFETHTENAREWTRERERKSTNSGREKKNTLSWWLCAESILFSVLIDSTDVSNSNGSKLIKKKTTTLPVTLYCSWNVGRSCGAVVCCYKITYTPPYKCVRIQVKEKKVAFTSHCNTNTNVAVRSTFNVDKHTTCSARKHTWL